MNQGITKKTITYAFATITMAILASSALFAPTFSAYADNGDDKDNDRKACKSGDKNKNGKYEHVNDKYERNCDSDHDFKN